MGKLVKTLACFYFRKLRSVERRMWSRTDEAGFVSVSLVPGLGTLKMDRGCPSSRLAGMILA